MSSPIDVARLAELAEQLTVDEQRQLVARLQKGLDARSGSPSVPEEPRRGSPAAVLQAVRSAPHLAPGDIDELERLIAAGRIPVNYAGVFDDAAE